MIDEDVEAKYIFSTLDANKVKQKIFDGLFEGKEGWGKDKAIQRSKIAQHILLVTFLPYLLKSLSGGLINKRNVKVSDSLSDFLMIQSRVK